MSPELNKEFEEYCRQHELKVQAAGMQGRFIDFSKHELKEMFCKSKGIQNTDKILEQINYHQLEIKRLKEILETNS